MLHWAIAGKSGRLGKPWRNHMLFWDTLHDVFVCNRLSSVPRRLVLDLPDQLCANALCQLVPVPCTPAKSVL
eukprot:5195747-Amphidinium_carterae.1